ncbi:MAG TPA: DinB family protein [Candidatus Limnocylindrales bacterium]|jgi:hypothetical protein|nr:DinB family protein [Candidatus Limnocylindrales bacterium]
MMMDAAALSREINDCRQRADDLLKDLTPGQFVQRPDPAKWSIAECIAHMSATAAVVRKIMRKGIARAREHNLRGQGPFAYGWRGHLLIWIAEPPPKFRIPAPKSVAPALAIDHPHQIVPDFMKAQDDWENLLKEADGLDLSRITCGKLSSLFRCQMSGGLMWMMAHQRRHLWQAENVKRQLMAKAATA